MDCEYDHTSTEVEPLQHVARTLTMLNTRNAYNSQGGSRHAHQTSSSSTTQLLLTSREPNVSDQKLFTTRIAWKHESPLSFKHYTTPLATILIARTTSALLRSDVLCIAVLRCAVLCFAVVRCALLCCSPMCCAMLRCAVLRNVALCCAWCL